MNNSEQIKRFIFTGTPVGFDIIMAPKELTALQRCEFILERAL
jgi:hypothetical protein